ncbi:MAG: gliding motility-associated C-terminal domain-containing protein [Bacteroidales bacterium]|nr:gliding motility-associated C-terminal domain-containing protein [Bacteroidales bacterium]
MKRHKYLIAALAACLFAAPSHLAAQSEVTMVNHDTIMLDACVLGGGIIYDDGGATNNYSDNFDGWVFIQASAGLTIHLTGNYVTEMCCDRLTIYDGTTLLVDHVAGTSLIDVTATSGIMKIGFNTDGGTTYSGFAFTWSISGVSASCANPVTNLHTTSVTTSSIALSWNATSALGPFTIISNGSTVGTSNTTSYTLNGLNAATYYDITVVATAAMGNRCCASELGVRTACGLPAMPYSDGFEGLADGSFPPCWLSSQNFDEEEFLPQVVASHHQEGERSLMLSCGNSESAGHFGMVATPPLAGSGNRTMRVNLLSSHSGAVVMVGTCDSVGSDYNAYGFTPLQTITLWDAAVWQEYRVTWNATNGRRLAFRMEQSQQDGVGRRVYLDGLSVETCGVDSLQVYHIEYDGFKVSWNTYGNPTCRVGVRPEGAMVDSLTFNNAVSPLTLTGLGADRRYIVTVYPTCGNAGISRSVAARTLPMPTPAATFCSDFYDWASMPQGWTIHTTGVYSSFGFGGNYFYFNDYSTYFRNIYLYANSDYNYNYSQGNYLVSERLSGLAGKQIAVDYFGDNNNSAIITIGTMYYPDDTTTFVPLATDTLDGGRHTLVATVPATSTGRHIAVRMSSVWSCGFYILGVQGGVALVDSVRLVHRRGSSVEFSWAQAYDTVLIQYGPRDFAIGTGVVDTFYHVTRGKVTGLTPATDYDFYVYRPGTQPCQDFRQPVRTTQYDYPMPYCEDFNALDNNNAWSYQWGDWRRMNEVNGYPQMGSQAYDGYAGNALRLASWGFDWSYYSTALLPDVEVDSNSILSFYINDNAPRSTIIVGTIPEGYYSEHFRVLDTIDVVAYNQRVHVNYQLRPSDTLFNCRLALRYIHPFEYSFYSCYIDELQIGHAAYEDYHCYGTDYTTAGLNFGQLIGTDSAQVTIVGGGRIIDTVIDQNNVNALGLTGLDTGTLYLCYVRPYGGCTSYAGYFVTRADGLGGEGSCFHFDDLTSYELPYHWAGSGTWVVTNDDYLQLSPSAVVTTHPLYGIGGVSFAFRARGADVGDTVLLGMIPADSIHIDSTHFNYASSLYTPIDTFVVDTAWKYYMLRLPDTDTNRVRLAFRTLGDAVSLDDIGFSGCPIVHFTVDGNTVLCELDTDQAATYYLHITDSSGEDSRVILINQNSYRVEGLHLGRRYDLWWHCLYGETDCRPEVSIRTGGLIPLPYCEDFEAATGSLSIPPIWDFFRADTNDELRLDTWGPSLMMNPYYSGNRWEYAVLPALDADSALSLHARLYVGEDGGAVQIGYLASGVDTGSFVPVWVSGMNDWQNPDVDLSPYADKRIAIRARSAMYLFGIHLYGSPYPKISLTRSQQLTLTASVDKPYWMRYHRPQWGDGHDLDTMLYIDRNPFIIYDSFRSDAYLTPVADASGYTCESERYYRLGWRRESPACCTPSGGWWWDYFTYCPEGQNGPSIEQVHGTYDYYLHLWDNVSQWAVLPEVEMDSLKHAGMKIVYKGASEHDTLVVCAMTDAYDTLSSVPIDTLVYTRTDDSVQVAFVDFEAYADTGRWIALHHLRSAGGNWMDVKEIYVDKCAASMGATATLSRWNQVRIDGKKTPFYVEYHHTNESCQGCGNPILRIDSVPQILILDPETTYDFYFRCDSNAYTCMPAQRVTTLGAPLEVPSCINFDTAAVGTVIHNWTSHQSNIGVTSDVAHSGTNSMDMPIGVRSYLITPDINIDSIQKVALSIWYQVEDLADRLVVGVMNDPNDLATFYPVRTLAPVETGVWQHSLVDFRNAPDDAHFIALRARSNRLAGGRSIRVDDIYVSNCAAFDFSVQKLTNNSIDLTWNQVGTPNTTITVLDEGVVANTYTNPTPPLHIEPLTMLHYYTFILNSDCGTDGYCSTSYTDTLSVVTPEPGVGCVNATDLASPQAVFFSGTYSNPYSRAGAINYGPMHPDSRHTVCYDTAQRDPRTGNHLRTIPEGYTSSVRLGNWSTNAYNPEAEGVTYSLLVDTSSFELLLLRYAAVLQDPLHDPADQPRFRMELLDTNYNIIDSACTSADFIADQSLGWNVADDGVLWKDWTAVGVDLSSHAGEQVYFRLTTYDCNEGSHYGYAYFTLECMRKNMNTESCGDVDSNTLSAPEGFHYRWYTSQSTATVSTEQSITVPSEDITYYCEVSKLDNPACNFTISAYGGTRYPMADFDTAMVIDSCRFFVDFTNLSGISRDGVNLLPGENCETAYWDFGNGTTSTNYHGSAVYLLPGSYTVTLISGIALDACQDTMTMTLVLELPDGMIPSDTIVASICDNQNYTFFGQPYNIAGEYHQFVNVPGQTCDSLYVLQLDVRLTSSSDTVAVACDSITWRGQTYTTDGTYSSGPIGLNTVGCDTTVNLILTVHPTYDTADPIIICPYMPFAYRGVDYGGPASIDTVLYSIYNCDSTVHVTLTPRDTNFRMAPYYYFDSLPTFVPDTMLISCAPTALYCIDSTLGATAWQWTLFTPDTTVNGTAPTFTYLFEAGRDSVSAYLTLVTTSEGDCLDTVAWPVFVFPSPVADFKWMPERPSILHPEVQLYNLTTPTPGDLGSGDSLAYLWRIQPTEGGEFDTTSVYELYYKWGEDGDNMAGDYTVQLVASWEHPVDSFYFEDMPWVNLAFYRDMLYPSFTHTCRDTAEHIITITNEYLQFPNLVTPNGDGINDRWEVVNLVEMGNYPMNELWIYDRTGALVYHVRNIRNAEQFWDPNATRSPDGTYYFRFMAEGNYGVVKRNGTIEVLRK